LLIDERKGRTLAIKEGVLVVGLLGVILLAKRKP
jgi:predicted nucleic acid-binding protein